MSSSEVMTVKEVIDAAFGDAETILYIIAQQLRVLDRQVFIENKPKGNFNSKLSVSEIKVTTNIVKKNPSMSKKIKGGPRSSPGVHSIIKSKIMTPVESLTLNTTSVNTKASTLKLQNMTSSVTTESSKNKSQYLKPDTNEVRSSEEIDTNRNKHTSGKNSMDIAKDDRKSDQFDGPGQATKTRSYTYYETLLQKLEENREKVIRVIHQRANSQDEGLLTPSPIASMDSAEYKYEKLLIGTSNTQIRNRRLTIVTQDQFEELAYKVEALQNVFEPIGYATFPENMELMLELRRGASMTDNIVALQISLRLEMAEKNISKAMSLIEEQAAKLKGIEDLVNTDKVDKYCKDAVHNITINENKNQLINEQKFDRKGNKITHEVLTQRLATLEEKFSEKINETVAKISCRYENVLKEAKLSGTSDDSLLRITNKTKELEGAVSSLMNQINSLDTGIYSQMTLIQEQLMLMQCEIDLALDRTQESNAQEEQMEEVNTDYNKRILGIISGLDDVRVAISKIAEMHDTLSIDLEALRKEMERLQDAKCDRDEVEDSLRDKANIGMLHKMMTVDHFEDRAKILERLVDKAHLRFQNQKQVWEKAKRHLQNGIDRKADYIHLKCLRDDVLHHLKKLDDKIVAINEILYVPKAAALTRVIYRDASCLSCSTPAQMDLKETKFKLDSKNKRPVDDKRNGDDDHELSNSGYKVSHGRGSRSRVHYCSRYCGGSHTKITEAFTRVALPAIVATPHKSFMEGYSAEHDYLLEQCSPCRKMTEDKTEYQRLNPRVCSKKVDDSLVDILMISKHSNHAEVSNSSQGMPTSLLQDEIQE